MAEIYHVLSRGVDKRKIFLDDRDYLRFIHDLFEFNDQRSVVNNFYYFQKLRPDFRNSNVIARRYIGIGQGDRKPRKLLVDILSFCLMPNHYHLLLMPKIEGAISKFMKKLNMGYARYFNERYERKGTLFEGRYKSIIVKNEAHFIHLPYYIHINPLDEIFPNWRKKEINDYLKAIKFLESYRWSSHLDYLGIKNFPSVTQREFLKEFWGGEKEYKKAIYDWLRELDIESIQDVILE